MKKRRRLIAVAVLLVAIAVLDLLLLSQMEAGDPPLIRGWRCFLTVVLAVFLALAKNTARWITVILTGLGAIAGTAGLAIFIAADTHLPLAIIVWMAIMTLLYAGISAFLAFSPGVAREIRRASALVS
jgi:hypothetical protein